MKRFALVLLLCVIAPFANATSVIVNVGGSSLSFTPQTATIDPGDTVTFINRGGVHNAVADDGSFRCAQGCDGDGHNGNGNASNANWTATVTFNHSGTFGYFCEIHGAPGQDMFGTIVVRGQAQQASTSPVPSGTYFLYALLALALIAAAALVRRKSH
ncbi:MAG TPA: plastocyanin/azurin family copper-binding protein [Rudaea sp.]|jgi:MYXO-CTERM domain-containing protein|nr:plastocyanin/azurin family copper-binding protein [Rudaea sp.]